MTDRYQIIKLIKKDQLGGVYLAEDTELEREITFRHFDPGHDPHPAPDWKSEFNQYAAKLQALQHPNLIAIYDFSTQDDDAVVIAQQVEGETMDKCIQKEEFSVIETINMALDLLTAIQVTHSIGIYHGAMHTGSIQRIPLSHGGHHYLIIDLGLKQLSSIVMGEETHLEDPILIPPEVFDDPTALSAQSDLFMIGQLCYTALAGGHPYAADSAAECAKAYRGNKTPSLDNYNPDVPDEFSSWITHMIDGDPKRRPASAEAARESLKVIAANPITKKNPTTPGTRNRPQPTQKKKEKDPSSTKKSNLGKSLALVAFVAILAAGGWLMSQSKKSTDHSDSTNTAENTASEATGDESLPITSQPIPKQPTKNDITPGPDSPKILKASQIASTHPKSATKTIVIPSTSYLDWVITQKEDFYRNAKNPYILDVSKKGGLRGDPNNLSLVQYSIETPLNRQKGLLVQKLTPPPARTFPVNSSALPQEWDVTFRPPGYHKGPLQINFFISQEACNLSFEITFPDRKQLLLKSRSKGPGVISVELLFPKIIPAKLYNIKVIATPTPGSELFTTGLHAVFLRKPPVPSDSSTKTLVKKDPPKKTAPVIRKKSPAKKPSAKSKLTVPNAFIPVLQPATEANHFSSKKWFHAEGSILKVGDGKYAMFYTRWPKSKSANARLTHPEVAIAASKSPTGPWKHWKTILQGRKGKWDQFGISHPVIKKFNGEFYLYYVSTSANINQQQLELAAKEGNTHPIWITLNKNRCIGVARAKSWDQKKWSRLDEPIIKAKPPFYGFSCSPSVTQSPDGSFLIMTCSLTGKDKIVSYIAKSDKPYFSDPITLNAVLGEKFSLDYNATNQTYQFLANGDSNHFEFLWTSSIKTNFLNRKIPKPTNLPAPTSSFHSPSIFFDDDGAPEVFIFHSDDSVNGGIFTIPFKK